MTSKIPPNAQPCSPPAHHTHFSTQSCPLLSTCNTSSPGKRGWGCLSAAVRNALHSYLELLFPGRVICFSNWIFLVGLLCQDYVKREVGEPANLEDRCLTCYVMLVSRHRDQCEWVLSWETQGGGWGRKNKVQT